MPVRLLFGSSRLIRARTLECRDGAGKIEAADTREYAHARVRGFRRISDRSVRHRSQIGRRLT